jgi:hypothetical protein
MTAAHGQPSAATPMSGERLVTGAPFREWRPLLVVTARNDRGGWAADQKPARKRMVEVEARLAGKLDVRAEDPRNNSRRATIKAMGTAVRWLIGSSAAVVMCSSFCGRNAHTTTVRNARMTVPADRRTPPRRR